MRCTIAFLLLLAPSVVVAEVNEVPLRNVEVVDRDGKTTKLAGFHRVSGEDHFRGWLGSGEVDVPYQRIREIAIRPAKQPGGRMQATITLRTGKDIQVEFDKREGEVLFTGFAEFGKVSVFFHDIRSLRILGNTSREDLPVYGPPAAGVDVRVSDRRGVKTELLNFRRAAGENIIPGVRGASTIAIPMRIVKSMVIKQEAGTPYLRVAAELRSGRKVSFRIPIYEEETSYRGEAEFGVYRIRLGKVRALTVHRVTPVLRKLDPVAAAEGREQPEGNPQR